MKKGAAMLGTAVIFLILLGMAYVRMAPIDPQVWHVPVTATSDETLTGGAVRVIDGNRETLTKIDAAARALPRTRVLAGSVARDHVTYVTRSRVFGFPDMTTVQLVGDQIRMFARLRFGRSDMGVNAARLERLVAAAE